MKRPSVLAGISFAFVVAVFAIPVWWGLKMAVPFFVAFRVITLVGYLAYCVYLLRTAKTRVGALTLATVNLVIALGFSFLPVTNSLMVGALVTLISRESFTALSTQFDCYRPGWFGLGCWTDVCRLSFQQNGKCTGSLLELLFAAVALRVDSSSTLGRGRLFLSRCEGGSGLFCASSAPGRSRFGADRAGWC